MSNKLDNSNVSKHLGKTSVYKSTYDPSLLVREPRSSNRVHLNIKDDNLPFVGTDTWNAYEVSALTNDGLPVTGIGKIVYQSNSPYIVESKSLKLYLNSFNMEKMGGNARDVRINLCERIKEDLSKLLECCVDVFIFSNEDALNYTHTPNEVWGEKLYCTIEDEYNIEGVVFDTYKETPELLEVVDSVGRAVSYHSALLKSNCRVTSQPDWGDVYVYIEKDGKTIDPISFLKYIVSFRDECHFHEEICETIYKRIMDILSPDKLLVRCLYARRGGIDINPQRASHYELLDSSLHLPKVPHFKLPKQ